MWIITRNGRMAVHVVAFGISIGRPWKVWGFSEGEEYIIGTFENEDEALYDLCILRAALREGRAMVDLSKITYGTDPEQASTFEPWRKE